MNLFYVFLMSMVPLIEQKGAIPMGVLTWGYHPILVFFVSLAGSMVPAAFIYIFFNVILDWMRTIRYFDKITRFIDKKVQKGSKKIEEYKEIGLIVFVGIPLPTTGVWTGSAVASFLGLDFKKSMLCVFIGAVISAAIITLLTVLAPAVLGL